VSPRPDDHQAGNHVHCAAVSDGTTAILFEPSEFLERLAALVPRPEKNLLIYRGLLAPNHKLRSLVVRFNRKQWSLDAPSVISTTPDVISNEASVISNDVRNLPPDHLLSEPGQLWLAGHGPASDRDEQPRRRLNYSWATLMKRAFEIDVLRCPRPGCSGRLRFIACITEPARINAILSSINTYGPSTSGSPSAAIPDSYASRAPPHSPPSRLGPLFDRVI
jgi:hypothetical protein